VLISQARCRIFSHAKIYLLEEKEMKRLVAILITLAICMSLASPALAANHSRHNIADVLSVANEYGVRVDVLASDDEMQHYISLNKDQLLTN
jgi:hypothetical protein